MSNPRRPGGDEPKKPRRKKRGLRWLGYLFLIFLGISLGAAGLAASFVFKAWKTLPAYEEFDPSLTSVIYDSKGRKVYELAADENRTLVRLSEIPVEIQQALIATEDARFYDHFGVDLVRLFGAAWNDIKYYLGRHHQIEGASTLTMQLTKNTFLTPEQSIMRKLQEMLIAIQLERRFTKDEILEKYLNQVSFGRQASGIQAAAQTYFSKNAKDLTLSEGAMLVGMLKATTFYDPIENYQGALNRREVVLSQMVRYGYLTPDKAAQLKADQPKLRPATLTPTTVTFPGDWYVDYVLSILTDNPAGTAARYGTPVFDPKDLYHKGLHIYTALDLDYQQIAERQIKEIMPERAKFYGIPNDVPEAAAVIMNHQTGEVKALVGGLQHKRMLGYNRATQAYRQPGSSIKPVVAYLPAIDLLGWGPATVIDDSPPRLNYPKRDNVWPENYEFQYLGLLPMRHGLEQSINAMAVRALEAVTPRKGIEYARKVGLSTIVDASMGPQNDENLALALGGLTQGVTPLEMTSAYGTLGSLGMRTDPVIITMIKNKHGEIIYQSQPRKQQVIDKESVWLMVDIMKGSILRGTAHWESKGFKGWPAAGKTGTTEDWHDAWFLGFTPEIVTGVWTGYDNLEERKSLPHGNPNIGSWTGAGPPTRIWTAIMNEIIKEKPPDWVRPRNVTWVEVCRTSGLLPSPLCPKDDITADWFRKGTEPTQVDNVWQMVQVVKEPFIDPATGKQVVDSRTNKPVEKYYLWRQGCRGKPENLLLIKRPTTYVRHPKNPWNFGKYWPADWWKEVPAEHCKVMVTTPANPTPQPGTQTGTQPGDQTGTQPGTGGSPFWPLPLPGMGDNNNRLPAPPPATTP